MNAHKLVPKVSVILTSYNHSAFVSQAIESVLNQTYTNYELIVADDCSTDESWEIINSYRDPRIKLFRSENTERGLINKVLKAGMVSGEYVAIHHSDDVWAHDKLAQQVEILDSQDGVAAVFTKASIIDESGKRFGMDDDNPTAQGYIRVFDKSDRSRHEWLNYFFYYGNCLCHPSLMIRKKCYDDLGYYNMNYLQTADYDYWTRLCLIKEIRVLQEPLVYFRVLKEGKNTSAQTPEKNLRERFEYYQIIKNFLKIEDADEILKIFPSAGKYQIGESPLARYLLARVSIDSNIKEAQLFGLEILASLMADEKTKNQCLLSHQFSLADYFQLTGTTNAFSCTVSVPTPLYQKKNALASGLGGIADRFLSDIEWWRKHWKGRLKNLVNRS